MSQSILARVKRDAARIGCPCVLRIGRTVALCDSVTTYADGSIDGDARAWDFPSAGMARKIVEGAVKEGRWRTAQVMT